MPLTPEQRSQRARIAALTRWSRHDPHEQGLRCAAGLRARLERDVDEAAARSEPGKVLPPGERERRVQAALRAHMRSLALKSSRARRARKAGDGGA